MIILSNSVYNSVYMQRINITLPDELAREFRRTIPTRKRSRFIAEAVKEKITKKRNLKKEWIKSFEAQKKIIEEIQKDFKYVDSEAFERIP